MADFASLTVALPWSLSHYIPLHGFHPLYQALVEHRPQGVTINAWDNAALSQALRTEKTTRIELLNILRAAKVNPSTLPASPVQRRYNEYFWYPNLALTRLLPGQIEIQHTTPYPGMQRPFIFIAESFESIFLPIVGMSGDISDEALRRHYAGIFESDLCLGIFSHLDQTLDHFRRFFHSPKIDGKLHPSRIGLARSTHPNEAQSLETLQEKSLYLSAPRFFLDASPGRNADGFLLEGSLAALRFWQDFRAARHQGKLYICGDRPSDDVLQAQQFDLDFLRGEERKSIVWITQTLDRQERDALLQHAHFFLSLGKDVQSVSIMRSMALGTIPVVLEHGGASQLVADQIDGQVLSLSPTQGNAPAMPFGAKQASAPGLIVAQLMPRITALMGQPNLFRQLGQAAIARARTDFAGIAYASDFWEQVRKLCETGAATAAFSRTATTKVALERFLVHESSWKRLFESAPGHNTLLYTGYGNVTELNGSIIHALGAPRDDARRWSVVAEYFMADAPQLTYAHRVKDLAGRYMLLSGEYKSPRTRRLIDWVSQLLAPLPPLHRLAARSLKILRMLGKIGRRPPMKMPEPHIALIKENVSGMNVISYNDRYYALPLGEGAFSIERFEAGGYSAAFVADTLRQVQARIAEYRATDTGRKPNRTDVQLIMEGVDGFNILRCATEYYAIPQGEGAFDYARVVSSGYSRLFSGQSVEAVLVAIQERTA